MSSTDAIGPLTLFFLMTVVGLQLTPADFRRVAAAPKSIVAGTLGQIVLLPLMTWVLVASLRLPPMFAAGAILLAASPGAGMSNVMTAIAGAHVALSVTLTAISSVLAVVTLPAVTGLGIALFLGTGDGSDVDVPVGRLMGQMFLFLLLPIALGMAVRARLGARVQEAVPWINRLAILGIIAMSVLSGAASDLELPTGRAFVLAVIASFLWTLLAMAIAWGLGALLDLEADDRFTFLVEFSARNVALAFIVAVASLGSLELGLFAGIYAFTGFPAVIALSMLRGRWKKAS
jgi:BASS family bile acid:Na+ symporter